MRPRKKLVGKLLRVPAIKCRGPAQPMFSVKSLPGTEEWTHRKFRLEGLYREADKIPKKETE